MNLENVKEDDRSQSEKTTYCMIPFLWNTQNRLTYTDSVLVVSVASDLGWD